MSILLTALVDNKEPLRVLIVEDEKDSANLLAILLRAKGYDVEVVLQASEAIPRLRAFVPHIVLLDLAMPGMSGYEIATAIRAEAGFHSIPLIAVSGYGDAAHRRQSAAVGIDHHLIKPVAIGELERLLADELARRK